MSRLIVEEAGLPWKTSGADTAVKHVSRTRQKELELLRKRPLEENRDGDTDFLCNAPVLLYGCRHEAAGK